MKITTLRFSKRSSENCRDSCDSGSYVADTVIILSMKGTGAFGGIGDARTLHASEMEHDHVVRVGEVETERAAVADLFHDSNQRKALVCFEERLGIGHCPVYAAQHALVAPDAAVSAASIRLQTEQRFVQFLLTFIVALRSHGYHSVLYHVAQNVLPLEFQRGERTTDRIHFVEHLEFDNLTDKHLPKIFARFPAVRLLRSLFIKGNTGSLAESQRELHFRSQATLHYQIPPKRTHR